MSDDDDLRAMLRGAIQPVRGVGDARGRIERRVRRVRVLRRAGGGVALACVLVAVLVGLPDRPGTRRSPVIDQPSASETSPARPASPAPRPTILDECLGDEVPAAVAAWLADWTTGILGLDDDGRCVLQGRRGPEPDFDTDVLGEQQRVSLEPPTAAGEQLRTLPDAFTTDGYPVVYLGLPDAPADPEPGTEPQQRFAFWGGRRATLANDGVGIGAPTPDGSPGGVVGSSTGGYVTPKVVVSAETAAVAVEVDGEPTAWTRPVAQLASVRLTRTAARDAGQIIVRELDADGTELDAYEFLPDLP